MDNTESKKQIASVYKDGICPHGSNIRHQLNNKRLHAKKSKGSHHYRASIFGVC